MFVFHLYNADPTMQDKEDYVKWHNLCPTWDTPLRGAIIPTPIEHPHTAHTAHSVTNRCIQVTLYQCLKIRPADGYVKWCKGINDAQYDCHFLNKLYICSNRIT